ncbi:helix-turn-helix domain-containing protein [Neptunitalea lumnitzerae]|uniref:Transcriptional regulatory protein n=1 Tax=Neptunitalea lumnitzerae TaxID=2965509 RepID=A0ABQ5MKC9_9FLAO|nr:helix-turn-helix transcriptional regulator [Neptunitalea sp. Y10]GLB49766.1 putative transcriptional regulatory protein [Neptunitalea sp. Y10]
MTIEEEYIRLIFGLKLKQIRTEKNLSLFGLSKLTGLSKSYLNEIEKGKKYPKTDKIILLSEHLNVPYDQLVSSKLDKNLAPIGDILQSKILKEIPLDLFGIQERDLIDIIANAPAKVNAFISTIIEISQQYNLNRESFFLASLRSYQEAHNNFFEDLENHVLSFAEAYQIDLNSKISAKELETILIEEYGYTINEEELSKHTELETLRSVLVPKTKTLLIANYIDEAQRAFIYAKEIAYNYLNYAERLYTFSWIKFENFEQVLNNFYASYFAGALIIPRKMLVEKLSNFFNQPILLQKDFEEIIRTFNASPETLYQRITNILPKDFQMKNLFFLRFTHKEGSDKYQLKKELHITHQQEPRANEMNEHYCRKWVAIKTMQNFKKVTNTHYFEAQISKYHNSNNEYLVFSSTTHDPFKENYLRSISIGILITPSLHQKIKFVSHPEITTEVVGVTCESCGLTDCQVRKSPPLQLIRKKNNETIENIVNQLVNKF